MVSDPDGQVKSPSQCGLYFLDTRVISDWRIYANGEAWQLLNGGSLTHYAARSFLTNPTIPTEEDTIPAHTLSFIISRSLGGGMHEDLDIINYGKKAVKFQCEVVIHSDFADIFEVKSGKLSRRGRITTKWSEETQQLSTFYRNGDFSRAVVLSPRQFPKAPVYANGRVSFEVTIEPGHTWHTCILYALQDGDQKIAPPHACYEHHLANEHAEAMAEWMRTVIGVETSNHEFRLLFQRSLEDMAALRLPIQGTDTISFMPAAGLPWFVAPFGRDSLIVSLQNILVHPEFARGALHVLGSLQANEEDDFRDAEPGKIFHELRRGELAHFRLIPQTPYYGSADATPLYLITLHAAWRATGDRALLEQHLQTAEGCLSWIDQYGDRDGDGFQEYGTRSSAGMQNLGWKDSGDAIVYPDGSLVKGPKALCELQGYVYDAWIRMAEVFEVLGKDGRARELRKKAAALFDRFNAVFWDDDLGFYALALDGGKRKVLTIASNPGHCLWSGIVPASRAKLVVERLMAPDMWSGLGIRTLSATNPAFNPLNYQTGSVWPHDNGIIAMGFKRYGFGAEAGRIANDISRGASHFVQN